MLNTRIEPSNVITSNRKKKKTKLGRYGQIWIGRDIGTWIFHLRSGNFFHNTYKGPKSGTKWIKIPPREITDHITQENADKLINDASEAYERYKTVKELSVLNSLSIN